MSKVFISLLIIIIFFRQILFLSADNTYINTTNITYDEVNNIVELADNSKINIDNTNILVDRGIIDYKNDKIEVFGNFYLYQDLNILSGKDLIGDTNLNNFSAVDSLNLSRNNKASSRFLKSDNLTIISGGTFSFTAK